MNLSKTARKSGFTLVELLVVIAIIAVLALVVVLVINPGEWLKRSRDASRLSDLANLQQVINVAVQESTASGTAVLCAGGLSGGYCTGKSTDTNARKVNGTGWVKVDFSGQTSVSVPTLPADPSNTSGAAGYHYLYCSNGTAWEINAKLESAQYTGKMTTDGGEDNNVYEVGSSLALVDGTNCVY